MKIKKRTFIILLLTLVLLPLLGNKDLNDLLHINLLVNILNYLLPTTLLLSIFYDAYKNKYKFKLNITSIITILFIICLLISLIFSIAYKNYTFTNLYKFITFGFLLVLIRELDMKEYENKFIKYLMLGSTIMCIYGICQYIFGFQLTMNGIEKYPGSHGRIKSTMLIATILDKYMALNIIYIYYLLFNDKYNKYVLFGNLLLCTITLGLTYSRTGLVMFIINMFILFIYFIIKKKYLLLISIPILLSLIYFIPGQKYVTSSIAKLANEKLNSTFISKVSTPLLKPFVMDEEDIRKDLEDNNNDNSDIEINNQLITTDDASNDSRIYFEDIAKRIMLKYPLTGIGIGNYNYLYYEQNASEYIDSSLVQSMYLYPHNMYYQLGAETGLIGIIIFILMLASSSINKKTNIFSILFLLGILLASTTESLFYIKDIAYYIIIMSAILQNKNINKKD